MSRATIGYQLSAIRKEQKSTKVGCVLRTATHPATTNEVNCEPHFGTHSLKLRTAPSALYTFAENLLEIHKSQSRRRWSRVQRDLHKCTLHFLGRDYD
jgi:hypothetical protein